MWSEKVFWQTQLRGYIILNWWKKWNSVIKHILVPLLIHTKPWLCSLLLKCMHDRLILQKLKRHSNQGGTFIKMWGWNGAVMASNHPRATKVGGFLAFWETGKCYHVWIMSSNLHKEHRILIFRSKGLGSSLLWSSATNTDDIVCFSCVHSPPFSIQMTVQPQKFWFPTGGEAVWK